MKVLVIKSVNNLGRKGDIINVKEGYARNFLFPQGYAVDAESMQGQIALSKVKADEKAQREKKTTKDSVLKKINGRTIEFNKAATGQGNLYEGVSAEDIARELSANFQLPLINVKQIELPAPIKKTGKYQVRILDNDNFYKINIVIKPQNNERKIA